MKTLFSVLGVLALVLAPQSCLHGQVRPSPSGSAAAQQKIREYQALLKSQTPEKGILKISDLAVGKEGTAHMSAKVFRVIDANSMLVGLEDPRTNKGNYNTLVMVKCSTKGIVDGKFYGIGWKDMMGTDNVKVTGTTTYNSAVGTKTVFVLEPAKAPARVDPPKKEEPVKEQPLTPGDFVGKWKIVDDKGATACYFTLTSSNARKSHVPKATGKWEVVDKEVRITWSDGWKDILRPEKDGVLKIAFGPGATWTDKPANTQHAIKE